MWVDIYCKRCGAFIERSLEEGPNYEGPPGYAVCDECETEEAEESEAVNV